jgi:hypothetical protein
MPLNGGTKAFCSRPLCSRLGGLRNGNSAQLRFNRTSQCSTARTVQSSEARQQNPPEASAGFEAWLDVAVRQQHQACRRIRR